MRRLIYVPIVHSEADLGDTGTDLGQKSRALLGERRWQLHQETTDRFWDSVASYLGSLDARQLRVYQDGLPADGEAGRRIAQEAARRGSRNYRLVIELLGQGAALRRTEDLALLWQEQQNLLELMQEISPTRQQTATYRSRRDQLMEERDRFVADTISSTLKEGEVGVLFMGAYHNVAPRLAGDISVDMVKDLDRVRAYFHLLLGQQEHGLEELAGYLRSPIVRPYDAVSHQRLNMP